MDDHTYTIMGKPYNACIVQHGLIFLASHKNLRNQIISDLHLLSCPHHVVSATDARELLIQPKHDSVLFSKENKIDGVTSSSGTNND